MNKNTQTAFQSRPRPAGAMRPWREEDRRNQPIRASPRMMSPVSAHCQAVGCGREGEPGAKARRERRALIGHQGGSFCEPPRLRSAPRHSLHVWLERVVATIKKKQKKYCPHWPRPHHRANPSQRRRFEGDLTARRESQVVTV